MKEVFAFLASGHTVGVEASDVYRVVDNCEITSVPLMPPFYLGILYYRGELFDVLDAGSVLYSTRPRGFQGNRRIVLLKWKGRRLALVPDAVKGLLRYTSSGEESDESLELIDPETIRERALELYD